MAKTKNNVEKNVYSAEDIMTYLGVSRSTAYNLMHMQGFPSFLVGKRMLVLKTEFNQWVHKQQEERSKAGGLY